MKKQKIKGRQDLVVIDGIIKWRSSMDAGSSEPLIGKRIEDASLEIDDYQKPLEAAHGNLDNK